MFTKTLIVFILCVNYCNCDEYYDNYIDVNTTSGLVRGQTVRALNRSVSEFLNIPYAEPPLGNLRFARPVPLKQPIQVSV
jgi:hypothetical protein